MKKVIIILQHRVPQLEKDAIQSTMLSSHWRASLLLAAPHRLAFAAGALIFAISALWWALLLGLRVAGVTPVSALPLGIAHSVLMCFGYMPLFFVGFLFTAGPKWLDVPPVDARTLLTPVATLTAAWLLFIAGVHLHIPIAALAVAIAAAAWSGIALRFAHMVGASSAADRVHAKVVATGGLVAAVALWSISVAILQGAFMVIRIAVVVGIWGAMAVVFVAVSHRMIPFFTAGVVPMLNAWRPMWLLALLVGTLVVELAFAVLDLTVWPLPLAVRGVQTTIEFVAATIVLILAVKWGLMQSLRTRLLAMLHVGFVWLGIALALQAASHGLMLATADQLSLGLAPTHALTMGYMGAMLFAMATRVSAGHSGRSLVADDFIWRLFWTQQLATLLRILAAAWPLWSISSSSWPMRLTALAGTLWALASVTWAVRHCLWYGQARADGKPG